MASSNRGKIIAIASLFLLFCRVISALDSIFEEDKEYSASSGASYYNPYGVGSCYKWTPFLPHITKEDMDSAFQFAEEQQHHRKEIELELASEGPVLSSYVHSPEARHQNPLSSAFELHPIEDISELFLEASLYLKYKFGLSKEQALCSLPHLPLAGKRASRALNKCHRIRRVHSCYSLKYRNSDGSCNNLQHPEWGRINTCFDRILPPDYGNGLSSFRLSEHGDHLPNPRLVSVVIHPDVNRPANFTHMVMLYGQFISHDINASPHWLTKKLIWCCAKRKHPYCKPVIAPHKAPFEDGVRCLNFVRRATCATCSLGYRQPANGLTSFLDLSLVYGLSRNETLSLRTLSGDGRMQSLYEPYVGELLPPSKNPHTDQCSFPRKHKLCFRAGDERVNQHPGMTAMHTIWLRQHNRIATKLEILNPHWSDEKIFQETRRITNAQHQAIVYGEFLPVVLGRDFMHSYNLELQHYGYSVYDPHVNPSIFMEFDTAAYRFGHSTVFGTNGRPEEQELEQQRRRLRDTFFFPFGLYHGMLPEVIERHLYNASQKVDPFITEDLTEYMYRVRHGPEFGLDLATINVHRGRDHGLNGYTRYLKKFFDADIFSFHDLDKFMPEKWRERFEKLYDSVHDIDLFSAGISEYKVHDGIIGPTFATIIAKQFNRLKFGDRFYFEHGGQLGSFTHGQLSTLRKTTLSKVLCANDHHIDVIQVNAFLHPSSKNPIVPCDHLPDIDLSYWEEH